MRLLYPCASGGDTQGFKKGIHYGLDFGWKSGESDDILATSDGIVTFEGFHTDIINGKTYKPIMVIIKHDYSDEYDYYSLYTHLASTCVDKGQWVSVGQKIGVKGNTGYSFGKHLHFQVMRMPKGKSLVNWNVNAIDPTPYLYRTSGQIFHYQGNFNIPLEAENKPKEESKTNTQDNEKDLAKRLELSQSKLKRIKEIIDE